MSVHHKNGATCLACEDKILTLDPRLQPAARHFKQTFEDGHVSWGYRGKEDQNRFFAEGKTHAKFPSSKHNRMALDEKTDVWEPASQAFDFFRINEKGEGEWKPDFCQKVWNEMKAKYGAILAWAGDFRSFKELDHIELKG